MAWHVSMLACVAVRSTMEWQARLMSVVVVKAGGSGV